MKNTFKHISKALLIAWAIMLFVQCSDDKNDLYVPPTIVESTHPNDVYIKNHMFEKYGTAVRWRWDDRFIKPTQRAVPVADSLVIPVTKLVEYLWIGPYKSVGKAGEDFMDKLFPAELQYMGSYIFKKDGSRLLGYAEAGARITLLNLNAYDLTNRDWLTGPGGGILATVHHEFTHIVHQNHAIPVGFNKISERYLGNGWLNDVSLNDAIKLGMVRNYGTMNEHEDFCEIVSHFLVMTKEDFEARYITQKDLSEITNVNKLKEEQDLNKGRALIAQKLEMVINYYQNSFGFNLVEVRDEMQKRLDYVITNNKFPE
jgi:substrate import-associated zinc metallohydrolase lipoprotein